jgi:hypothetical protein
LFSAYHFVFRKLTSAHEACQFFPHGSKVNIRGTFEAVEAAQLALLELLAQLHTFKTVSMPEFPAPAFGKLLGRGGEKVKRMSAEFGVDIRVPRVGQAGALQSAGPVEAVDAVMKEVSALI